jgi:5'-3' exoribonuclease 2
MTHDMVVNRGALYRADMANKSAAAVLKSQLLGNTTPMSEATSDNSSATELIEASPPALGKRKAELLEEDDSSTPGRNTPDKPETPGTQADDGPPDNVRLWEEGYADRYYEHKFHVDPKDNRFRHEVARCYVEGLAWVLLYYFQGCPSWTWYYPYHYAPFAADFKDLRHMTISFEKGVPFKPFEQLMGVLPAASRHAIPDVFHSLMTDEDSEIIDFYPEEFPIDLNGKKFAWQGVALLPFIDEKRLLDAMAKRYPQLTPEVAARNELGRDILLVSERHPLYHEIVTKFYSKKQGSPNYRLSPKVSEGLLGGVEKDDAHLPGDALTFPLEDGGMPSLDDDRSIRLVTLLKSTKEL